MSGFYVDPPYLVTAGVELVDASGRYDQVRQWADTDAAGEVRGLSGREARPGVAGFDESWSRYAAALGGLNQVLAAAAGQTADAVRYYQETDAGAMPGSG